MAHKKNAKDFNICVAGLSGYDIQDKQLFGSGKSCLCNRLVRPSQNDYNTDHNSIISTSDFVGSVINNDHFLYWGCTEKLYDDHMKVNFKVIEQTEFIDDESYTPLSNGGQLLHYTKRASATKLVSPGKFMYINRDQVALQSEFEQVLMDRDGKFQVDGFICVYDVSSRMANNLNYVDLQEEILTNLLMHIQKSKKPVAIVATKCDDVEESILQRAHQFVHNKKLHLPLLECSADEMVNVDLILHALWQITETKNKSRYKVLSYQEGLQVRKQFVNKYDKKYLDLVKGAATNSSLLMSWKEFLSLHKNSQTYQDYIVACGSDKARKIFNQQAKKIRRHYEDKKLNEYLNELPEALNELLPTIQSIEANDWKWENCQRAIKNHLLFNKCFKILPTGISWTSPDQLFDTSDTRISFDVLQVERARACFDGHYKKLRESARKQRMRVEFQKLLDLTTGIKPGTSWPDASQIIAMEESYKYLDEMEKKKIFETHLREITAKAKNDFQELLFESASMFSKLSKDARPSPDELKEICEFLQDDIRYKNLENLGDHRDIQLFTHIALMQSPNRCLSGPEKCMDRLIQDVVKLTESRTNGQNHYQNEIFRQNEDEIINLLVIGNNGLARELEERIRIESSCNELEFLIDGKIYDLNVKVFEAPVKLPNVDTSAEDDGQQTLTHVITEFNPQGYMLIYSTNESLQYVQTCLKHIEDYEQTTNTVLPLIILLGNEAGTLDDDIKYLRTEGHNISNCLQCIFVDYPYTVSLMDDRVHSSQVEDAMRGIVDVINKRVILPSTPSGLDDENCDLRILVCVMCGDDYSVELILSSMLQQNDCYSNPSKQDTIILETAINGSPKTIAVTLGSYHRAFSLKNQIFHGFILVYSVTRLASLETLKAYASTLSRHVPVQVLAVTGSSSGASILFHEENAMVLLHDESKLSSKLNTKLQQTSQIQANAFLNFFGHAWENKADTELILQGIKKRRKEPLPELPKDVITNGILLDDNGDYAEIKTIQPTPDSPFVDIAVRNSFSDSTPSSPDHTQKSFADRPTRTSTSDSREYNPDNVILNDDPEGLYAKVDKSKKHHFKFHLSDKHISDEVDDDDDDDDMVWQENAAYESNFSDNEGNSHHKTHAIIPDRPYASVQFTPRSHKYTMNSSTLPPDWRIQEPTYESIEQIRSSVILTNDVDSESNVSSKSKDSMASIESSEKIGGVGQNNKLNKWFLHEQDTVAGDKQEKTAPIAKPEDDEQEDMNELRERLANASLAEKPDTSTPINKEEKEALTAHTGVKSRKRRSESNHSSTSLDTRTSNSGLWGFKKIMSRVSPNPSPVNSDAEPDTSQETIQTTPKKNRSFKKERKRKQSPSPAVKVDTEAKDRSNTIPPNNSPKSTPKFNSLEHRPKTKFIFRKVHEPSSDSKLTIPSKVFQSGSLTLDRPRKKGGKYKSGKSKDDLDLPVGDVTMQQEKKKKTLKTMSIKLPKTLKPKLEPNKSSSDHSKMVEWGQIKSKQRKTYNYFGEPLEKILGPDGGCPIFVLKAIKHVEANGMQSEGIYRLSGKKQDVESIMEKFDSDQDLNLQELGVIVHAITGALKNFFKLLPEPVIPYDFGKKINAIMGIMDAEERLTKLRDLVNQLPPANYEVFGRFMCHLDRVSQHKQNKMDTRNLQVVLYPTLLRPDFNSLQNISQNMNMGLFIQTCIEQSQRIFGFEQGDIVSLPGMVEAPSTSSLAKSYNDVLNDSMERHVTNRLSSASTGEPSFSESVLNDPSVEIIISSPSVHHRSSAVSDVRRASVISTSSSNSTTSAGTKADKRKSVETTI